MELRTKLLLALGLTLFALLGTTITGETYIVDDDWEGADFATIAEAANGAADNDTILVHAGTYNERFVVRSNVSVIGNGTEWTFIEGAGIDSPIWYWPGNGTLSGMTFREFDPRSGDHYGAVSLRRSGEGEVGIKDCVFINSTVGISIGGEELDITNCSFLECGNGILMNGAHMITIQGCDFTGGSMGITLYKDYGDLDILDCTMSNMTSGVIGSDLSSNIRIEGVQVSNCSDDGVNIWLVDGLTLQNMMIENCETGVEGYLNSDLIIEGTTFERNRIGCEIENGYGVVIRNSSFLEDEEASLILSTEGLLSNIAFVGTGPEIVLDAYEIVGSDMIDCTLNGDDIDFFKDMDSVEISDDHDPFIIANCSNVSISDHTVNDGLGYIGIFGSRNIILTNCTVENGTLGLLLKDCVNVTLQGVIIYNCSKGGIDIIDSLVVSISISGSIGTGMDGITMDTCDKVAMVNVTSVYSTGKGLMLTSCSEVYMENTWLRNNTGTSAYLDDCEDIIIQGFLISGEADGIIAENVRGLFADNLVITGTDEALNLVNSVDISVVYGTLYDNHIGIKAVDTDMLSFNGTVISGNSQGMYLDGMNTTIENCTIFDNKVGINLFGFWTDVNNNSIYANEGTGLQVLGYYVLVHSNNFGGNGENARDSGAANRWNTSTGGNHWYEYKSYIKDDPNEDLEPYKIDGGAGSKDFLPLKHPLNISAMDLSPPRTTVTLNGTIFNGDHPWSRSLRINCTATDWFGSGVDATYCRLWNGSWYVLPGPVLDLHLELEGVYYIEYYSVDNEGLVEKTNNLTFGIDRTPPISRLAFDGSDNVTKIDLDARMTILTIDDGSGVQSEMYRFFSNGNWTEWKEIGSYTTIPEDALFVEWYTTDNVGNQEDVQNLTIQEKKEKEEGRDRSMLGDAICAVIVVLIMLILISRSMKPPKKKPEPRKRGTAGPKKEGKFVKKEERFDN